MEKAETSLKDGEVNGIDTPTRDDESCTRQENTRDEAHVMRGGIRGHGEVALTTSFVFSRSYLNH